MMRMKLFANLLFVLVFFSACTAQNEPKKPVVVKEKVVLKLTVGAEQTEQYIPLLKGKKIGVVANHTSMINETHLIDSLLNLGVNVVKVFSPEHGFRGKADAGERVKSDIDSKTGLPLISLYGKNKKPYAEQVKDLDIIIFDIQDVGARFYTYISTMQDVMEACAENDVDFIVLDRPNPNGHYVDGPVLKDKYKSFIGMANIPIVHGMTVGEYAKMVNGEFWLKDSVQCKLTVIKNENYTHHTFYTLPIKPSPNLPNMSSIYLYPSLCLFEGTVVSVGRGTDKPFQIIGYPTLKKWDFSFTPESKSGAKNPKLLGKLCNGYDLSVYGEKEMRDKAQLNLTWLIEFYNNSTDKEHFFKPFFYKLSGNNLLEQQIKNGMTEQEIRATWQDELKAFKAIRTTYLIYPDFE